MPRPEGERAPSGIECFAYWLIKDSSTSLNPVGRSPARDRCFTGPTRSLTLGYRDSGRPNRLRLVASS